MQGKWTKSSNWNTIVDPLNGEPFIKVADVNKMEIQVLVSAIPSPESSYIYAIFSLQQKIQLLIYKAGFSKGVNKYVFINMWEFLVLQDAAWLEFWIFSV